jgi:prepilin-type N-terminal cleavage/methylation domain-containing protein
VKRRGYTLFEMVIVLALIVLLAGLAVPPIEAMYADYKLESAADQVRGKWAAMRARAITEGRPYRFCVIPGTPSFRVAPDSGDFWSGGDAAPIAEGDAPPLVVEDSLPRDIPFSMNGDAAPPPAAGDFGSAASADSGSWTTVAVFLPDGTARNDAKIDLTLSGTGVVSLRLRALTGGVTTRRGPADSQP